MGKGRRGRNNFIYIKKYLACSLWLHRHDNFVGSSDIIDKWIREAKESIVSF